MVCRRDDGRICRCFFRDSGLRMGYSIRYALCFYRSRLYGRIVLKMAGHFDSKDKTLQNIILCISQINKQNECTILKVNFLPMKFFQAKTTWTNAEFIPLKICIASIYLLIGSYFHNFIYAYCVPIFVVFLITVVWSLSLWVNKMKSKK